jgi:hypothetical protein
MKINMAQLLNRKLCKVCWKLMNPVEVPCPACGLAAHADDCSDEEMQCNPSDRGPWSPYVRRGGVLICKDCKEGDA